MPSFIAVASLIRRLASDHWRVSHCRVLFWSAVLLSAAGCSSPERRDTASNPNPAKVEAFSSVVEAKARDAEAAIQSAFHQARLPDPSALGAADNELAPIGAASDPAIDVPGAGRVIALPRISRLEMQELFDRLRVRLRTELGYVLNESVDLIPPDLKDGVEWTRSVQKQGEDGVYSVTLGFRRYLSQQPDLLVYGVKRNAESGAVEINPDMEAIMALIQEGLETLNSARQDLGPEELDYRLVQLSYSDLEGALTALQGLGMTVVKDMTQAKFPVPFDQLPLIVKLPEPPDKQTGLVGGGEKLATKFDLSIVPSTASALESNNNTAPDSQMLIYFHPAHPEQFSRARKIIDKYIDRPARQIFVEAMVLEISESGLNDLGIEWELRNGNFRGDFGTPNAAFSADSLNALVDSSTNFGDDQWALKVRALIEEGKAEILSRPSVLTLNNRQATIRVGTDIPIATAQEGLSGGNKIAFNFSYLPTGILLNIRPRINEGGDEVSMLVDIVVSSSIPGQDLQQRDKDGTLLASAPTVATRRVQTYARIDDKTPFIIGGLVSHDDQVFEDKVPGLSRIPLLGKLFTSTSSKSEKREVIIVLTPFVLAEARKLVPEPILPKDEDQFDHFGNKLFRDIYRIRSEDVFDLGFIFQNRRLQQYRDLAVRAIQDDFTLAEEKPFSYFANNGIPGEYSLVVRMLYDVIKRLSPDRLPEEERLDHLVQLGGLIFLRNKDQGGFGVEFLSKRLAREGGGEDLLDFFEAHPNEALVIQYRFDLDSWETGQLNREPVPRVYLTPCEDRDQWLALLRELNQAQDGRIRQSAIVIHRPEDLLRLRRALLLKDILELNGNERGLTLNSFSVGRKLLIPDMNPEQTNVVDANVATLFYFTEDYYSVAISELERVVQELDRELRRSRYRHLLE